MQDMLADDHRDGHAADHGLPLKPGGGKLIDAVEHVTFVFEQRAHVARCLRDARYHDR